MEKLTVLNPFSVSLQKYPFMEVPKKPVYSNGDYKIYAYFERHYVHTFKNIVIAERGKANTDMVEGLINDIRPTDEGRLYHDYERPKQALADGLKAAKKLKFKVQ